MVLAGRVKVNGKVVNELGARADLATDRVEVDGRPIEREEFAYYVVNKPKGMVTTMSDPEGRPALNEILQKLPERVYPVGRLDFHTSGVLLVTNDGDLAQALLHPSKEVPKTYVAKLNDVVSDKALEMLRRGVTLDDGYKTAPASVTRLRDEEGHSWLEITITEGKNRQIHRMIDVTGFHVMRLSRVRFAGLSSDGLRPSQVRALEPLEVALLKRTYQGIHEAPAVRVPRSRSKPVSEHAERERRGGSKFGEREARGSSKFGEREARGGSKFGEHQSSGGSKFGERQSRGGSKFGERESRGGREVRSGSKFGEREARGGSKVGERSERAQRDTQKTERGEARQAQRGDSRGPRENQRDERGEVREARENKRGERGESRAQRENTRFNAKRPSSGTKPDSERRGAKHSSARTNAEKQRPEFDKGRKASHKSRPT
jgi:23S rRNA pseudouridine2605 synthase